MVYATAKSCCFVFVLIDIIQLQKQIYYFKRCTLENGSNGLRTKISQIDKALDGSPNWFFTGDSLYGKIAFLQPVNLFLDISMFKVKCFGFRLKKKG